MLLNNPVLQFVNADGVPQAFAKLYLYLSGTVTPASMFSNEALTERLEYPVVADARGVFPPIYIGNGVSYRAKIVSTTGEVVSDIDPLAAAMDSTSVNALVANRADRTLSNVSSRAAARTNLGLGAAAIRGIGVTAGTVVDGGVFKNVADNVSALNSRVDGLAASAIPYATVTAMSLDLSQKEGTLGYVYLNNGSPTDPDNGYYQFVSGVWGPATWYTEGVASVVQPLVDQAEGFADAAAASANDAALDGLKSISLDLNALPAVSNNDAIGRIGRPRIRSDIVLPDNLFIRYCWRDNVGYERFNLIIGKDETGVVSSVLGVGASGSVLDPTGFTGPVEVALVAVSGSVIEGVGNGEIVGYVWVDFKNGSLFGDTNQFTLAETPIVPTKLRLSDGEQLQIDERVSVAVAPLYEKLPSPFYDTVRTNDPTLYNFIRGASVRGGFATEDFVFNHEKLFIAGSGGDPDTYRINITAYSPQLGAVIASWSKQDTFDWTVSRTAGARLTRMANGAYLTDYAGIEIDLDPNWTYGPWTRNMSSNTTPAQGGVRKELVQPPQQQLLFGPLYPPPNESVTIGADGDSDEYQSFVETLYNAPLNQVARSSAPLSDRCSVGKPVQINVFDNNHDEQITPRFIDYGGGQVIGTGLVMPEGLQTFANQGTRFWMNDNSPLLPPMFERNFANAWVGGVTEQFQNGYIDHMDPAEYPKRATVGPSILRTRPKIVTEDRVYIHRGTGSTAHSVAGGASNGCVFEFRRCLFIRIGAGPAAHVMFHTSPGTTDFAEFIFEDCGFGLGMSAIHLIRSHALPAGLEHVVTVSGCSGGPIVLSVTQGSPTVPGWRVIGDLDGFTSVDPLLIPTL